MPENKGTRTINQELLLELDQEQCVARYSGNWDQCDSILGTIETGATLTEALKRLWNADVQQICREAYEHGKTIDYELPILCENQQYWYTLKAEPVIDNLTIQGTYLSIRNTSLGKRSATQSRLQEKMTNIALMAGQIAHKLNNPLAAVLNRVGSILVTDPDEDNSMHVRRELELIQEQIYSMSVITNALVAFSKEPMSHFAPLQINDIIEKSIELSRLLQTRSNIEYQVELSSDLPLILGNEITLEQSFINVIRNALEAMPDGGIFTISSDMDTLSDDFIKITFKDTGCGIDAKHLDDVFDPFFKTKDENHSGLGLSISYGIIANHNGMIEINSKLYNGTIVTIFLPVYRQKS